jgi:hypothetical protein
MLSKRYCSSSKFFYDDMMSPKADSINNLLFFAQKIFVLRHVMACVGMCSPGSCMLSV